MSLEYLGAELIMGLSAKGVDIDPVVMLGRQHLTLKCPQWARSIESELSFSLHDIITQEDDVYAEPFFERLGASSVDSIDFSDYQGATTIHDMNDPLPAQLEGKYKLIHDGGTIEHVFHTPNYLANCMKLLKPGGHYVGILPMDNWTGHGFYQFSPELMFRVFSNENGFRLRAHGLAARGRSTEVYKIPRDTEWKGRFQPGLGKQTLLLIVAEKLETVTPFEKGWPQQSDYATRWEDHKVGSSASAEPSPKRFLSLGKFLPKKLRQTLSHELLLLKRNRQRNALIKQVDFAYQLVQD